MTEMHKLAVAFAALAVAALAGVIICREAFRASPDPPKPLASSLESGCRNVTDAECVMLANRCHRGREAAACEALERLPHMSAKLKRIRSSTRQDPGHPAAHK